MGHIRLLCRSSLAGTRAAQKGGWPLVFGPLAEENVQRKPLALCV